jgi:4-diphosphocytidyl-2-C-methyl-D-erythritol kinase
MYIHRPGTHVVVQAPAKLNLFFEVLGRRDDGYHEIETLMCPIDLYDTLYCREEPSGHLELTCESIHGAGPRNGPQSQPLPQGADNLAVKAIEVLRRRAGIDRGVRLRLVKRIPAAAGLGGGSSDAAAAIAAADQVWGLNWPLDRLADAAAEVGSDVPFFLFGGPAICRGRGERIESVASGGILHFVIVFPPVGLSTAAVYAACQPARSPRTVTSLVEACAQNKLNEIGRLLFNRLQPAAKTLSPWIERVERALVREDCPGHGMSGSGSSCFGVCRHAKHARWVARRLQADGLGRVFAVRSCR